MEPSVVERLVERVSSGRRRLEPGAALFQQGDPAAAIHAVLRGRIRLERALEDGGEVTLHVATAPATIAEAALFSDVYHCRAVAETASTVAVLDKAETLAALAAEPDLSGLFLRHLAAQVRDLRAALELRGIRRAEERVMAFVQLERSRLAENRRPFAALARELGLAPESFYRAVGRLVRAGRLGRDGRTLWPKAASGERAGGKS